MPARRVTTRRFHSAPHPFHKTVDHFLLEGDSELVAVDPTKSRHDWPTRADGLTRSVWLVGRRGRHEKAVDFAQVISVRHRMDAEHLLDCVGRLDAAADDPMTRARKMASKHILEGLIKWSTRDRWADRFERILEDHEKERCAIIHDQMDRHYHRVLDEPVPALGGETPRSAVKTESGRGKVSDWLKMMENRTAKSGVHDSAMASYNFSWLWTELGISELRR